MSIERINIGGREGEPFGKVISFEEPKNPDMPEEPEIPEEDEEEQRIEEIIPDPSKKDVPPPKTPSKRELGKIWRKIWPGADKPN